MQSAFLFDRKKIKLWQEAIRVNMQVPDVDYKVN